MAERLVEIQIPQQKLFEGIEVPSAVSPSPSVSFTLSLFTKTIETQKPYIQSLLHKSGAILLRGFPIKTASDFNDVVEAFGFDELPYVGGAAPRNNVVGRVYTANESPPDQKIPFHHEMSQVHLHNITHTYLYLFICLFQNKASKFVSGSRVPIQAVFLL